MDDLLDQFLTKSDVFIETENFYVEMEQLDHIHQQLRQLEHEMQETIAFDQKLSQLSAEMAKL